MLGEYSKDCSIKLSLLPHLKAQAILIRNGKPLALQRLKYLHVPQRADKPPRHPGVPHLPKARSAGRHPGCPSPSLLARPPARLLRRGGGRNQTRGRGSPRETRPGKSGLLLATLLCHILLGFHRIRAMLPASPVPGSGRQAVPFFPFTTGACRCSHPWRQTGASPDKSCTKNSSRAPWKPSRAAQHQSPAPLPATGGGERSAHPLWPARAAGRLLPQLRGFGRQVHSFGFKLVLGT